MKKLFYIFILCAVPFITFAQETIPETSIISYSVDDGYLTIKTQYELPDKLYQITDSDFFNVTTDNERLLLVSSTPDKDGKIGDTVTLTSVFKVLSVIDSAVDFSINYQLCDKEGLCLRPSSNDISFEFETITPKDSQFIKTLLYILFGFLGGIILNIMPCVLPVLSIKTFSLVKQSNLSKKQIFNNSLLYSLGILASLLILAFTAIILKAAGRSIGWGFQFQNPRYIMFLIVVLYVFSFAMFDFIILSISGIKSKSYKSKYVESFFTGILTVLLATPCTAPFLGAALGFAFVQPWYIIILMFTSISLGLSLPFLIIGAFPKALKLLPKPGNWMNIFKEIMAFILLLTVLWLLSVLVLQIGSANLIRFLIYLLILTFCMWIFRNFYNRGISKKQRITSLLAILIIVLISTSTIIKLDNNTESTYFDEVLVQESIDTGEKVFVIFSAKWCATCRTNDALVLSQDDVKQHFIDNNIKVYYGDNTEENPIISSWLQRYNRAGVPLYLYFDGTSDTPKILPEIINKNMIFKLK